MDGDFDTCLGLLGRLDFGDDGKRFIPHLLARRRAGLAEKVKERGFSSFGMTIRSGLCCAGIGDGGGVEDRDGGIVAFNDEGERCGSGNTSVPADDGVLGET
jgi:hypothetical protein